MKKTSILFLVIILLVFFVFLGIKKDPKDSKITNKGSGIELNNDSYFKKDKLKTNTSKTSIGLNEILDGGPGKDGIPALTNPSFTTVKQAEKTISLDIDGIVVSVNNTIKFYPFNIMVWHEIVNDTVGGKPLLITFCPLCGSSIVFDTKDKFGVSGKLHESNLLMYDKKTESLWAQSTGTALVGDRLDEKLDVYSSQVMSFRDFKEKWPNGQVLSVNTGYTRNYDFYPYRDYDNNEEIYFPVSVKDNRFPSKTLMYVVNAYNQSVAFPVDSITYSGISVFVDGKKITSSLIDKEIIVKDELGQVLPGYHEMWFSWATHHKDDGIVWNE